MQETVQRLIEAGAVVHWRCEVCRASGPVDLAAIRAARGSEFSLSNRRPSCRLCPGRVAFEDRSRVYHRPLDTIATDDPTSWAFYDAERARLYALGWRVVMGKWVRPE